MRIAILGDGGWGTTLTILLSNKGLDVSLWGAFPENIEDIKNNRENKKFLPGIKIPKAVFLSSRISKVCDGADIIVFATPSRFLRDVITKNRDIIRDTTAGFVSVIKGIEQKSLKRMSEVIFEVLGERELAVLSGPSIAPEVARGVPTAVTVASSDETYAKKIRDVFRGERFRVYNNSDVIGVELGGALKNIIAIACGISDGLGYGANTKSAIITRALVEITRLGAAMGARRETFMGLSGLGDMITTCFSRFSRNRTFGEKVGKGASPEAALKESLMEVEGAWTCRAALKIGKKQNIDLPITNEVYSVIYEQKSPLSAMVTLMARQVKAE